MSGPRFPLEQIEIPIPCHVPWESMTGDDRIRLCGQCNHAVYQLKNFTREEAERLIASAVDRLCIQLYRRPDGTVVTKNCDPGPWPQRLFNVGMAAAGAGLAMLGINVMGSPNANSTFSFVGGMIRPPSACVVGAPATDAAPPERPTPVYAEPGPVQPAPPPREK